MADEDEPDDRLLTRMRLLQTVGRTGEPIPIRSRQTNIDNSITCDNRNIYVMHFNLNAMFSCHVATAHEIWRYEMETCRWENLLFRTIPRVATGSIKVYGNYLYLVGVLFGNYERQIYRSKLDNEIQIAFDRFDVPSGFPYSPSLGDIFIGNSYFCFSEGRTTESKKFVRLNFEGLTLSQGLRACPYERVDAKMASCNDNEIYLLGGCTLETPDHLEYCNFVDIPFYNIDEDSWHLFETYGDPVEGHPTPRVEHSVVRVPGTETLLLFGGISSEDQVLSCCWRLDLRTASWKRLHYLELQVPVFSHKCLIAPSERLYVFGGFSDPSARAIKLRDGNSYCSHLQSTRLAVPSLLIMTWELLNTLCHFETLTKFIPIRLLQKLLKVDSYSL